MKKQTLYESVGGMPVLDKVHKIFYGKVYAHEWLGQYFVGHDQSSIEHRQSLFMAEKMGGDVQYFGKAPAMAHRHMFISQELFDLRHHLLEQSLEEAGVVGESARRWLAIDAAFYKLIVKPSIASFYGNSFRFEKRVIIPKPPAVDIQRKCWQC